MKLKNKDIAKQLGISPTAVSLAINNRPGVSQETRRKVLELLGERLPEVPTHAEQNASVPANEKSILLSIHKKTGFIINDKPFFSELIEAIQQEAMQKSYILNVVHHLPDQDIDDYIKYLKTFQVSGVLLLGTEINEDDYKKYLELELPVVVIDTSFININVPSVSIDNRDSIIKEMQYALKMGHKDIGYLKSRISIINFERRFEGYTDSLHKLGLENRNHPVIELPCTLSEAYSEMKDFLDHPPKDFHMPSIFLADLDYIALGAMQALKERGYRIPEDVSLIGYDDLSVCMVADPHLSSTRVDQVSIGVLSVNLLTKMIEEKRTIPARIYIASEFIERESVCKKNGR